MYELIVLVMIIWLIWRVFKQFGESDSLNDNHSGPSTTSNQSRMSVKTKYDYELETYERELRLQEKRRQRERDRREKERQLTKNALEAQARTLDRLNNINKNDDMHEYTQEMSQRDVLQNPHKKEIERINQRYLERQARQHKIIYQDLSPSSVPTPSADIPEQASRTDYHEESISKSVSANDINQQLLQEARAKLARIEPTRSVQTAYPEAPEYQSTLTYIKVSAKEQLRQIKRARKRDKKRAKYQLKHNAAEFMHFTSGAYSLSPTQVHDLWFGRNYHNTRCRNITGVYVIYNQTKDKYYVGQSARVFTRVLDHFDSKTNGDSKGNPDIMQDFIAGDRFQIFIKKLTDTPFDNLDDFEKCFITWYDAYQSGYNKTRGNGRLLHVPKNKPVKRLSAETFFSQENQKRLDELSRKQNERQIA